jgi:putative transposase
MVVPDAPNQGWSLDFEFDALTDVRRFRILAGVKDCSRETLIPVEGRSLSRQRVVRELDRVHRQNSFIESFNAKLRDECLNETLFGTLGKAQRTLEK